MKESLEFLENLNINKKEYIVVATSGGPDSMTLLHILKKMNYNIICAHVNHNIRKESENEYKFVENYCKNNDIKFIGMKIDKYKNNKFTEMEARKKRYEFFTKILKEYNSKYLFTAHHGDDLIETILMRIIRGTTLNSLKGFSIITNYENYSIIRPLVFYTKQDIENYIKDNNIPCVYDLSNNSKEHFRNRIRLDILPILKKENKNIHKKFIELNKEIEENNNYINKIVTKEIKNNYKNNEIDLEKFNKLDEYIQKKELETILLKIYKDKIILLNKKHINNIINLLNNNKLKSIDLPNNIKCIKSYKVLKFIKNKENKDYKYIFNKEKNIDSFGTIKLIDDTLEKSNYVIKLNTKDITLPLIIRNINNGDYIEVKNMHTKKKISRIFIDEKIEKNIRKTYPILTDSNNNVLWIPGIKKSKYDCYNKEKYDIIIKYTKKENVNEEQKK